MLTMIGLPTDCAALVDTIKTLGKSSREIESLKRGVLADSQPFTRRSHASRAGAHLLQFGPIRYVVSRRSVEMSPSRDVRAGLIAQRCTTYRSAGHGAEDDPIARPISEVSAHRRNSLPPNLKDIAGAGLESRISRHITESSEVTLPKESPQGEGASDRVAG